MSEGAACVGRQATDRVLVPCSKAPWQCSGDVPARPRAKSLQPELLPALHLDKIRVKVAMWILWSVRIFLSFCTLMHLFFSRKFMSSVQMRRVEQETDHFLYFGAKVVFNAFYGKTKFTGEVGVGKQWRGFNLVLLFWISFPQDGRAKALNPKWAKHKQRCSQKKIMIESKLLLQHVLLQSTASRVEADSLHSHTYTHS